MKVRLSPGAQRQARNARAWWKKHRDKNPKLFQNELVAARRLLGQNPYAGNVYKDLGNRTIYRLNLTGTRRHLYYYVDDVEKTVRIVAVWGAQTADEPELDDELESDFES